MQKTPEELQARKQELEKELMMIDEETRKAQEQLKAKPQAPENVVKVSKQSSIKSCLFKIHDKLNNGHTTIELWAQGASIPKAFFITQCDKIKDKLKYKEAIPLLEDVEDKKEKDKKFSLIGVKIVLEKVMKND